MDSYRVIHVVPAVNHYGEFTSRLLQHREWRQEALRAAELSREFRGLRHDATLTPEPFGARRLTAAFGALLVRAGQRLQGGTRTPATAR